MTDIFDQIKNELDKNHVVLFMKGYANSPSCGFSAFIANLLQKLCVQFKDINVLEDENIREGIKRFSNWPTIPQLYIKSEFIGGCDIVKEMYQTGEFLDLLKEKKIEFTHLTN